MELWHAVCPAPGSTSSRIVCYGMNCVSALLHSAFRSHDYWNGQIIGIQSKEHESNAPSFCISAAWVEIYRHCSEPDLPLLAFVSSHK
jgi:hypothetical protein